MTLPWKISHRDATGNGKPLISLRVGSAKNPWDSISPICKTCHLLFSIPKIV